MHLEKANTKEQKQRACCEAASEAYIRNLSLKEISIRFIETRQLFDFRGKAGELSEG